MGEVGFELVSVYRNEDWGSDSVRYDYPIVTVTAYFKRAKAPDEVLPEKPQIGFRPPEREA